MPRYPFKSAWKRMLAGVFDALGRSLFHARCLRRKTVELAAVRRVLVIRLDHIGDVVMARPALRALHKKFPHAAIDLLVTRDIAPLFASSKEIRTLISASPGWFDRKASFFQKVAEFWRLLGLVKSEGYDVGIDLRGDVRNIMLMFLGRVKHTIGYGVAGGGFLLDEDVTHDPAKHQVKLNLDLLSSFHVTQDDKLLPFEYSAEEAQQFLAKVETLPPTTLLPRIAIHLGSGYPSKRWPFENFQALIQRIDKEALAQIVLIGTEAEKEATPGLKVASERLIDLRGKTTLKELPILLDVCDVFIGNDSGPAHIAAAQGLEVLLLVSGTNDIGLWHPWTERLTILQHDVPCAPCGAEICPVEAHPCMELISVDRVYQSMTAVLSRLRRKAAS
jgi:lipopolysaccharide heptosyltransferase II